MRTLWDAFLALPMALQRMCGDVSFPSDDGSHLLKKKIQANNSKIFGCSDAAKKGDKGTHTWIHSSGQINDIDDQDLNLSGSGPVDGHSPFSSSGCCELQGITALVIMAKLF